LERREVPAQRVGFGRHFVSESAFTHERLMHSRNVFGWVQREAHSLLMHSLTHTCTCSNLAGYLTETAIAATRD